MSEQWNDVKISTTGLLALFLGGSEDSFTGLLLQLMAKADPQNFDRLKLAFPCECAVFMLWQATDPAPTFAQLREITETLGAIPREGLS